MKLPNWQHHSKKEQKRKLKPLDLGYKPSKLELFIVSMEICQLRLRLIYTGIFWGKAMLASNFHRLDKLSCHLGQRFRDISRNKNSRHFSHIWSYDFFSWNDHGRHRKQALKVKPFCLSLSPTISLTHTHCICIHTHSPHIHTQTCFFTLSHTHTYSQTCFFTLSLTHTYTLTDLLYHSLSFIHCLAHPLFVFLLEEKSWLKVASSPFKSSAW